MHRCACKSNLVLAGLDLVVFPEYSTQVEAQGCHTSDSVTRCDVRTCSESFNCRLIINRTVLTSNQIRASLYHSHAGIPPAEMGGVYDDSEWP